MGSELRPDVSEKRAPPQATPFQKTLQVRVNQRQLHGSTSDSWTSYKGTVSDRNLVSANLFRHAFKHAT